MTRQNPMPHKSPVGQVRGLGSSKTGTQHWFMMQITTAALIPLTLYLLGSFLCGVVIHPTGEGIDAALAWLGNPVNGIAMCLMIPTALFNSFDYIIGGLFEDYVHHPVLNALGITVSKFAGVTLAIVGVVAVLKIMLGA